MHKTLIKICGITNTGDAETAVSLGADALGFVFYPGSPRYVNVKKARSICKQIPGRIVTVGVFVNAEAVLLDNCDAEGFLSMYQLHGTCSPDVCARYPGKAVKSFSIGQTFDPALLTAYSVCEMFHFDSDVRGLYGGSGKKFDWSIISSLPRIRPIMLAGGLTPENIADAIACIKPKMVDVSSSIEAEPGKKNPQKIEQFIRACREADAQITYEEN